MMALLRQWGVRKSKKRERDMGRRALDRTPPPTHPRRWKKEKDSTNHKLSCWGFEQNQTNHDDRFAPSCGVSLLGMRVKTNTNTAKTKEQNTMNKNAKRHGKRRRGKEGESSKKKSK
jgi:hypothetical protein